LALYGLDQKIPSIMVTGSHIPADRNGIKFNKPSGEILKIDEEKIREQAVELPRDEEAEMSSLPSENPAAREAYLQRYICAFPSDCLKGQRLGFYQHSAVGRDLIPEIFSALGAEVECLGFSETFIPVDTEAIRPEDIQLAKEWAETGRFDALISTDGDSDRPLLSDEQGLWMRGDVLGILAAKYLGAESVHVPVNSNTALEKSGWFASISRTRIGSPFVIDSMIQAEKAGENGVVGYEANGGFLTQTPFFFGDKKLSPLPTRDAVLPVLATLLLSVQEKKPLSELLESVPARFTRSDRIQNFPTPESRKILQRLSGNKEIETFFGAALGALKSINQTDGLRMTFSSSEVLHLRPSGNAPEFRCYAEADSAERAEEMRQTALEMIKKMKTA
jgi:phosphomannomutase